MHSAARRAVASAVPLGWALLAVRWLRPAVIVIVVGQSGETMGKVLAGITISVDGFITGPGDGPDCGLGVGGERLHYWVFGGPWSYDSPGRGEPAGEDKAWLEKTMAANGAVIAGRGTYEAAGHWSGKNPWGIPFFIVTHRPADQPPDGDFIFSGSLAEAIDQAQ